MNKLNALGQDLLSYKKELLNDSYSDIIKRSLELAVNKMAEDGVINVDILYDLTHNDIDLEQLTVMLLSNKACVKTNEELLMEYELLREKLNNYLDITDNEDEDVNTSSDIRKEIIVVTKQFMLGEEFVKNYFDITNDSIQELISRKGLLEKFAILRLNKIFKDFVSRKTIENEDLLKLTYSEVFYESSSQSYGIHIMFKIPVEVLEDDANYAKIVPEIQDILNEATEYYNSRMLY